MINLQKNIYECLASCSSTNFSRLSGIFSHVDKNTPFPHILVGISGSKNLSNFAKKIFCYTLKIDVFDKSSSNLFVMEILDEIRNAIVIDAVSIKENPCKIELCDGIWRGGIEMDVIR
jgi:hypothetical protein